MQKRIFTSESVTEGHPDKVCDQISDGVLDAILAQDPTARVACECCATTGMVMVMGEISTECYVDIPHVARDTICRIGYDKPESGFNGHTCAVLTAIDEQSGDIAMGVNSSFDDADTLGAGDQGMMFGFACSETPELMPAPITYAQQLAMKLSAVRKSGELDWLRPDGKSQVSVQYGEDGSVERIDTVVVSTQHADSVSIKDLREAVIERVIRPTLPARLIDGDTKFYVKVSYNYCLYICELYHEFYIFRVVRPNSMSQTAGSEYEEVIITNYDPRKACWQLSLESLLNCGSEARYELIHEPERPIKTTN